MTAGSQAASGGEEVGRKASLCGEGLRGPVGLEWAGTGGQSRRGRTTTRLAGLEDPGHGRLSHREKRALSGSEQRRGQVWVCTCAPGFLEMSASAEGEVTGPGPQLCDVRCLDEAFELLGREARLAFAPSVSYLGYTRGATSSASLMVLWGTPG